MPGKDGTGPLGQGAMTGIGLGPCGCGMRRRFGRGFGRGFGWRGFYSDYSAFEPIILTKEEQKKILEEELKEIEAEKETIEKRLKEMK